MLRVLLDAHVSPRVVAVALREDGHDVRAISEEPALEGLGDPGVLELAATEQRIVVTHNVRDFAPLLRMWAESGRSHAGCILIHGIANHEFGRLLRGIRRLFGERPTAHAWKDLATVLSPQLTDE